MKKDQGDKGVLFFKGERTKENYLDIHYQPSFADALQLLRPKDSKSYQSIPLKQGSFLTFHYTRDSIKRCIDYEFDLQKGAIFVKDQDEIPECHYLSSFLIKEGGRVTYMTCNRRCQQHAKIKKQPSTLSNIEV